MTETLMGKNLDEFRLDKLLGQGGMAKVYRAVDTIRNQYVAIKVIDANLRDDSEYTRRFELEAQSVERLSHPHVVGLYKHGKVGEVVYMAMEYIKGRDLGDILTEYRNANEIINTDEAVRVIKQICAALDYIHSQGIIHRDVKPSNILVREDGSAVLTDFGLALMLDVGTRGEIFGTPHYLSPEQAVSSAKVVPQSDLYSIGVMIYEMFVGKHPFDANDPMDIAMMHISEPPPAPRSIRSEITPELEAVILKSLAKKPEDRYPTGQLLASALEAALSQNRAPTRKALPRHSIVEMVQLDLAKNPLPPLPHAVSAKPKSAPPAPSLTDRIAETQPAQTTPAAKTPPIRKTTTVPQVATPTTPKRGAFMAYLPYIGGGLVVAIIGIVLIMMLINPSQPAPEANLEATQSRAIAETEIANANATTIANATGTAQAVAIVPPQSDIESTATTLANQIIATQTQIMVDGESTLQAQVIATQTQVMIDGESTLQAQVFATQTQMAVPAISQVTTTQIELAVVIRDDKALRIVNMSEGTSLTLANLQLRSGTSPETTTAIFSASVFNVNQLGYLQCVDIVKRDNERRPDSDCTNELAFFISEGRDNFWKEAFSVYYNNQSVGICPGRGNRSCTIRLSVSQ